MAIKDTEVTLDINDKDVTLDPAQPTPIATNKATQFSMPNLGGPQNEAMTPSAGLNAVKSGLTSGVRGIENLSNRFYPKELQTQESSLQKTVPGLFPTPGYTPQSTPEKATEFIASQVEPVSLATMLAGGQVGKMAVKGLGLVEAEKAAQSGMLEAAKTFNSVAAQSAATDLYKNKILSSAIEHGTAFGAMEGINRGLGAAASDADAGQIAKEASKGFALGAAGGAFLGASGSALANRALKSFGGKVPSKTEIAITPLSTELQDQVQQLVLKQAQLGKESQLLVEPAGAFTTKIDKTIDSASQEAANHIDLHDTRQTLNQAEASRHQGILDSGTVPLPQDALIAANNRASQGAARIDALQTQLDALPNSTQIVKSQSDFASKNFPMGSPERQAAMEAYGNKLRDFDSQSQDLQSKIQSEHTAIGPLAEMVQRGGLPASTEDLRASQARLIELQNESLKLGDDLHANLSNTSDTLASELEKLRTSRSTLLSGDVEKNQLALKENLESQARLTQQIQDMQYTAFRYTGKPPTDVYTLGPTIHEMLDTAKAQVDKVDAALQKGLITDSQAVKLKQAEFNNALALQGLNIEQVKAGTFEDWVNQTTKFNRYDQKIGTRMGEVVEKTISGQNRINNFKREVIPQFLQISDNLNGMGYSDEEITRVMQYFESKGFNPKAAISEKLVRQEFQGQVPGPQAQQEFMKARTLLDQMQDMSEVGHVEGYIPLREKSVQVSKGRKAEGISDPTFAQERTSGEFDPDFHENNFRSLMGRYTNEVANNMGYAEPLKLAASEMMKLRGLGQVDAANALEKFLVDKLNLKNSKDISAVLGQDMMQFNKDALRQLSDRTEDPASFLSEFRTESQRLLHSSLISNNLASILKHAIQPETMLSAEIGPRWVAAGRASMLSDRALRNELAPLMKYTTVQDISALDEISTHMPQTAGGKALRALQVPLAPGNIVFGKVVRENRMVALVGSYKQFQNTVEKGGIEAINSITSSLTGSEQALVRKTLIQDGQDEAAKMYAIIRTRRTNFAFNSSDRPDALSNVLGQAIPFTTFSRGVLNNAMNDITTGNVAQLAKRIAIPMVGLYLFEQMTGRTVPGSQPIASVGGLASTSMMPQVTQPIKAIVKGDPGSIGKAITEFSPIGAYQRAVKQLADPEAKSFILPKATTGNSIIQKLMKKVQ